MTQPWLTDPVALEEFHNMASARVAVDFDGTLHPYTAGWTGSVPDDEPPMPGAREFLEALVVERGYTVVVFSARADHPEGLEGIVAWLAKYELLRYVIKVTHEKPAAIAYVDDRAVSFTGDWDECLVGVDRLSQSRAHGAAQ